MKARGFLKIILFLALVFTPLEKYVSLTGFTSNFQLPTSNLFAGEDNRLTNLTRQIIEAKTNDELFVSFEELKSFYFRDNKYTDFIEFLRSCGQQKKELGLFIDYYTALSRYYQLKYLEDTLAWEEYFSSGNQYRDEIQKRSLAVIEATKPTETLNLYAKLLLLRFHKERQGGLSETLADDLTNTVREYSQSSTNIVAIKDIGDQLLAAGDKINSKKLYNIYVEKLASSGLGGSGLEKVALEFYRKENPELAEVVYDTYIEGIKGKVSQEKLVSTLVSIARSFTYKDQGPDDPLYAEKIFQEIEALGLKGSFDQELIYLRAFNLEKIHAYKEARDIYLDLLKKFPQTKYADEATFKIGLIHTYISDNLKEGRIYLEELAKREKLTPQVISSLYQLGLLTQWEGDLAKAKEFYDQLIVLAQDNFQDTVKLTRQRLKEIEGKTDIEYNLKTFLDARLKKERLLPYDATKINLKANPSKTKRDSSVNLSSAVYSAESGCAFVELSYLWSGDLGVASPRNTESAFPTQYNYPGTKVINLVVVNPAGIVAYDIDFLDTD